MSDPTTPRPLFLPGPRVTNLVITVGFLALGWALYVRYLVIEMSGVGLACEAGLQAMQCAMRRTVMAMFNHNVFGLVALAAAVLHVIHPHTLLFCVALAAGASGVVLYNGVLSALALSLLVISFARPIPPGPEED